LLPPSAFDTLARLQVDYPMLFQLSVNIGAGAGGNAPMIVDVDNDATVALNNTNNNNNNNGIRRTHCGVLEFTAEEGCCYIPFWMMQNLLIEEGTLITVTNVSLPKATFVKLQPQSVDFLEISNPRAVLEHALRNFSCVTKDDIIQIPYNNKNYHFALKEVDPSPAACIIETDCNVDFDAPVGYVEPERTPSVRSSACPSPATTATSMTVGDNATSIGTTDDDTKPSGTRIVNGEIVRPDEYYDDNQQLQRPNTIGESAQLASMLAEKIGGTGVQRNSAIPEQAPEIDYWAIQAGDGARLDGKVPAPLKDASGNVVDIRQVRAEAAQRRAAAAAAAASQNLPSTGKTVNGETVVHFNNAPQTNNINNTNGGSVGTVVPVPSISKRTKRVGSKYSKLKSSTTSFQGSANNFDPSS
jgi:ubiquitin fusion degradation protein 1